MGLGVGLLSLLACLGVVSAIDAGVALVNRGTAFFVHAVPLPGLELRDGVPESLRTMVVVPTLLTTREEIAAQVERLEIHHLASPEGDLHFALLSDWIDADAEHADGDAELVAFAREGIEGLNRRYGPAPAGPRFLLLHRRRVWNDSERRWIGWERKRGKLHELNRLLRGATDTTFIDLGAAAAPPPQNVRYVVTLGLGHAIAARHGQAADRQDGASAQSAAHRRGARQGRGRLRRASASGDAVAARGRRGFAVSTHILERQRDRSLFLGCFGRLPGHVRRGFLRRERASTISTRSRAPSPAGPRTQLC